MQNYYEDANVLILMQILINSLEKIRENWVYTLDACVRQCNKFALIKLVIFRIKNF